ncbi:DUF371 domain-containing protein [Sulfolobus sp. S-194]|uniref:DUF371 domain-containing protein n=1 Tax=Sulfolobus sp. S-194 TaxID=2512240 RepID=UPI0014373CC1|nr:DUF371 domain-containing protein [Sulfolobus sp. S-194]QIW24926.1 DUF371 domain-containing protein [Sulfolobus sp. S-194]
MIAIDTVKAYGHNNVKATHRSTLEITKDNYLTPKGDCIIGINANKGAYDLSPAVKQLIKKGGYVYVIIKVNDMIDIIHGYGNENLTLENPNKIIIRKSNYTADNSTIMIKADKSAKDIKREIIKELKENKAQLMTYILASDLPLEDYQILRIIVNWNPSISA